MIYFTVYTSILLLCFSANREAEGNLALKDLRSKVGELNAMWQKHLKVRKSFNQSIVSYSENCFQRSEAPAGGEVPSTPKKLLGSLLEGKVEISILQH